MESMYGGRKFLKALRNDEIEAFLHEIGKIEAIVEIQAVQVVGNRHKGDQDRDDQDQGADNLQIGGDFHKE